MKKNICICVSFLMIVAFSMLSCQTTGKSVATAGDEPRIEEAWWVIYNIPEGFWKNWDKEISCYGHYNFRYSGDLKEGDIVEAGFHTSKITYNFEIANNIDYEKKILGSRQNRFQTWSMIPWSNDIFHIGHTHYWFKTKDGKKYDYMLDVPRCGKTTSDGIEFVYTEDTDEELLKLIREGRYRAEPALMRPRIIEYSNLNGILEVKFSVEDDRFNSGHIDLFDKEEKHLACTELFLSPDKKISSTINKGKAIYSDGRVNEVTIDLKNLTLEKDNTIDKIAGFHVVISDGKQYSGFNDKDRYDFVSWSQRVYLAK